MTKEIRSFLTGFRTLFTGIRLLARDSEIRRLAIIPLILDVLVLVAVFSWGLGKVPEWVDRGVAWAMPSSDSIWSYLFYWPMYVVVWGAFLGLLLFVGYVFANFIAAPFNALLAEKTLERLRAKPARSFSLKHWLVMSGKMMWASLLKSLLFLVYGAVFFAVSFVPVVGVIASIGMLLIMAFDSADYSFEVLEFSLRRRFRFFRRNFFFFLGSSVSLGLTLLIPGLNFLLFPAFVVGHADLVQKRLKG